MIKVDSYLKGWVSTPGGCLPFNPGNKNTGYLEKTASVKKYLQQISEFKS
jgi:hypothetical protein